VYKYRKRKGAFGFAKHNPKTFILFQQIKKAPKCRVEVTENKCASGNQKESEKAEEEKMMLRLGKMLIIIFRFLCVCVCLHVCVYRLEFGRTRVELKRTVFVWIINMPSSGDLWPKFSSPQLLQQRVVCGFVCWLVCMCVCV